MYFLCKTCFLSLYHSLHDIHLSHLSLLQKQGSTFVDYLTRLSQNGRNNTRAFMFFVDWCLIKSMADLKSYSTNHKMINTENSNTEPSWFHIFGQKVDTVHHFPWIRSAIFLHTLNLLVPFSCHDDNPICQN